MRRNRSVYRRFRGFRGRVLLAGIGLVTVGIYCLIQTGPLFQILIPIWSGMAIVGVLSILAGVALAAASR